MFPGRRVEILHFPFGVDDEPRRRCKSSASQLATIYATILLVPLIQRDGLLVAALRNRVLIWLGSSYAVYLFHQAVSGLVHGVVCGSAPQIGSWSDLTATLALALTLLLAQLSYAIIERRVIAYGHGFSYR